MITRRSLLTVTAIAVIVLGLMYVARPAGHIPPYDANLVRLAENDIQGYCTGEAFWKSGGTGDARLAAECRSRLKGKRPDDPKLTAVIPAFCAAIVEQGWEGNRADCAEIMVANQYWPTYAGSITDQWNRARPYPRAAIVPSGPKQDGSRTGDRDTPMRPTEDPRGYDESGYGG